MALSTYSPVGEPEIMFTAHNTAYEGAAGRKSFQSIDFRETIEPNVTPEPSLHTKNSWSENSNLTVLKEETENSLHSRQSSLKSLRLSKSGSWIFEIVSLLISAAAVAGIIGVLARFDGRPLPTWPLNITLNTLIALLSALANANLAIPLQSGLSQLKWVRFKAEHAPLTDMEVFDDASRGTWGAIKLLVKARGGFFGSFGAAVTIIALALGPFSQQVATYRTRLVQADTIATVPTALNYTGVLPGDSKPYAFVPILPLKSAVYYGLFSESDPSANLKFSCPTGNCTWPEFTTLAVCSSCVDLTQYLTRYCEGGVPANGDASKCGWQVPQGAYLNSSADVFSMTSKTPDDFGDSPYSDILRLIFMGTEAQNGLPLNYNPWATQCTLSYCLQTFNSSVNNGVISENVTDTITNSSVVDIANTNASIPISFTGSDNTTYVVSEGAMLGVKSWFGTLFATGSATRNASLTTSTRTDNTVVVNLTVGISSGTTYFDSDIVQTFYWDYYEYAAGLENAMSDLATSMTVAFRSFNGAVPVSGQAFTFESYVHVRWAWITLPVLVVFLTGIFLTAAILRSSRTKTKLWKSSALAMLFYGLDGEARDVFKRQGSLEEKKMWARGVRVKLEDDGKGEGENLLRFE